jgi:hypothetical protein
MDGRTASIFVWVAAALIAGCDGQPPREQRDAAEAEVFQKYIDQLSEATPDKDVERASEALRSARERAFDALLANLENQTPAKRRVFQTQAVVVDDHGKPVLNERGELVLYHPKIGDACFAIFQMQLESGFWKAWPYYQLTRENAKAWWEKNRHRPIQELRIELAEAALAQAQSKKDRKAAERLEEHLRKLRTP